jgi:hypothetical protein
MRVIGCVGQLSVGCGVGLTAVPPPHAAATMLKAIGQESA